jgi:hypothetical protein
MTLLRFLPFLFIFLLDDSFKSSEANPYVSDFRILVKTLQELHPGLYNVTGKEQFDKELRLTENKLSGPVSRNQALYIIQEFIYKLGDHHMSTTDGFSGPGVEKIIPFKVAITGNELFIRKFPADTSYNGAKIFSINHTTSKLLIDSLNIFYCSDGARNITGKGLPALFNSLYASFCQQPDSFIIKTDRGILKAAAIHKGEKYYDELIAYSWCDENDKFLKEKQAAAYGYFRFLEFEPKLERYPIENRFNEFMKEMIAQNKKAVIIDLRYNSGGSPYMAARIASYFLDTMPVPFQRVLITPASKPVYRKYLDYKHGFVFRRSGTKKQDSLLEKTRFEHGLKMIPSADLHYTGKVYVITSEITASAATMFCSFLRNCPNVIFVGSETSGAINYFWAHRHCEIQLPNSGLHVTFPTEIIELIKGCSGNEKPVGLIPDIPITYSIKEIMAETDKEMEWIISDIEKQGR